MKRRVLLIFLINLILCATQAFGLGRPENVLVVQNGNSPVSTSIAAYYMAKRNIPAANLVTVYVPDSSLSSSNENISLSNYINLIEIPVRDYLSNNGLTNQIQFIVLTKGIPIKLSGDSYGGPGGGRSVDSVLAGIDLVNEIVLEFYDEDENYYGTLSINRYWRSAAPFTHAQYGGYLVTRLDGYTEADAKALVDRALAVQSQPFRLLMDVDSSKGIANPGDQPKSLLLPDGSLDETYALSVSDYNADMVRASQVISGRPHLSVTLENTPAFVSDPNPLCGYISWGSNDWQYVQANYLALTFAPGGIAETAVSSSGRTFLPTSGGQSLIADLLDQGASGAKGYVSEPYLDAIASPSVLMDLYTSGRNLAESFYAASRFVKWKGVVLGDPLCALQGTAVTNIAAAKALPDDSLVAISNAVVVAGSDDFSDRIYITDQNRASGIQVHLGASFAGIARGSVVTVRGLMGVIGGERAVLNASLVTASSVSNAPAGNAAKRSVVPRTKKVKLQTISN